MESNLFQVDLLTEDDLTETEVVKPEVKKEEPKEKVEEKKDEVKTPAFEALTDEEVEVPSNTEEEVVEQKVKVKSKKEDKITPDGEYFKALAQFHIDNGDWDEWEGWDEKKDEVEWNAEMFAELQKEQITHKVSKTIEEERGSYGDKYKELLEYAKTGAPVENLYKSFQEQMDVESLDPTNIDQAEKILKSYYESLDWDSADIEEEISVQRDRGDDKFKELASKRKGDIVKAIQEDRKVELEQAKVVETQKKQYWEDFNKQVRTFIHKEDVPEREKKEKEKFLFEHKYQDDKGNKFTEYDKISSEIRNNPEKFYQFASYLMNPEKYQDKAKVEKEVKKNIFTELRAGQASLSKNKSTQTPELQKESKSKGQYNPFQGFLGSK